MRRSTLVMGVGAFLTLAMVYLWVLSGHGVGYASSSFPRPGWKDGDATIQVRTGRIRWIVSRYDSSDHSFSAEAGFSPFKGQSDFDHDLARDFEWSKSYEDGEELSVVMVPFWVVVVTLVGGTVVVWRILRKKETRMIAEGRVS